MEAQIFSKNEAPEGEETPEMAGGSGTSTPAKRRFAVVGTGRRVIMFLDPIAEKYGEVAELVGLCDRSETRRVYHQQRLHREFGLGMVPVYRDFDEMLKERKPDIVIVCTVDAVHDEYIVRALEAGCDVITEKPITTDESKARHILDVVERTGKSVRVTFNMRWMPAAGKVKELIAKGAVGRVKSVNLEYMLNASHGADYFRRWHSEKANSGGLLVHKSTHHFDLVNWWVNSIPDSVFAFGNLAYYGRANALARGEEKFARYDRYTGHAPDTDPFRLDMEGDPILKALYLDAEKEDTYIRDRNVFREGIDIEDSLGVLVKYRNGAILTYSLTAFCPMEGFRITINGDGGRIEFAATYNTQIVRDGDDKKQGEGQSITVLPLFAPAYNIEIPHVEGSHGGGDLLLQERLFGLVNAADPLNRDAGHEQGTASAVIGFAANHSIESGLPVKVSELLRLKPGAITLDELV